jgi:hypothetical protein
VAAARHPGGERTWFQSGVGIHEDLSVQECALRCRALFERSSSPQLA